MNQHIFVKFDFEFMWNIVSPFGAFKPSFLLVWILSFLFVSCGSHLPKDVEQAYQELPSTIDFNFHVRPILSDRCYSCHGPDENTREANLRLDLENYAFAALSQGDGHAFVKNNPGKSQALQRILSTDPEYQMPPPESNLELNAREKAIIAKWIAQGAKWKEHWAFIPPEQPEIPISVDPTWKYHNPIDGFIQKKLQLEGLEPAPEADRERLLRRLNFDLTGLPPSIEEMDAFLTDKSPNALEKVVDRLLASDAHAERLTMDWLDLARYADSHGMHADGWRLMWPWRDWVIHAFKDNLPYNQFVTWQLAGDLLPNATEEQKLATAFHRNHPMTAEGGAVDEEFRMEYVIDRTNTTATAFLGLTVECAQCHDHKFDPITQREYYQLAAFFNNVKELGMTGDDGNYGPMLALPGAEAKAELKRIKKQIEDQEKVLEQTVQEISSAKDFIRKLPPVNPKIGLVGYFPLERLSNKGKGYSVDGSKTTFATESVSLVDGYKGKAMQFDFDYDELYLEKIGLFKMTEPFSVAVWINTHKRDSMRTQTIMGTSGTKNSFWRGWDFFLDNQNRLSARIIHCLPHNYIQVSSLDTISRHEWTHLAFSYDGSTIAEGLKLYINGKQVKLKVNYNRLYKNIHPVKDGNHEPNNRAIRVGKSYRAFTGENGIFVGLMDEIRVYKKAISPIEVKVIAGQNNAQNWQQKGLDQLSETQFLALLDHFLLSDQAYQQQLALVQKLKEDQIAIMDTVPEIMVMEEMPEVRPMFVLNRGQYDQPLEQVQAATPKHVLAFSDDLPPNRLGLAQWLFASENPLTARVAVNHYWQMLFGKGLVNTPDDFGSQGSLPSHPELLDWLAVYFVESGWDIRSLLKLIVTSATYRQSSLANADAKQKDPGNIFLARSPSYRLTAEMIRDNALAASGLLVGKIGGESVKPYQPEGLWIELGNFSHKLLRYQQDQGENLYRRSLYTFIRRTSPPPYMLTFDAPNRDVCTVRRENTNTPLQALTLLNDPQFVEAARVLAEKMQIEGGSTLEEQLTFAFRRIAGRHPDEREMTIFKSLFNDEFNRLKSEPEAALSFLSVGEFPVNPELDQTLTAALAMVASMMLNHDEAYMKR